MCPVATRQLGPVSSQVMRARCINCIVVQQRVTTAASIGADLLNAVTPSSSGEVARSPQHGRVFFGGGRFLSRSSTTRFDMNTGIWELVGATRSALDTGLLEGGLVLRCLRDRRRPESSVIGGRAPTTAHSRHRYAHCLARRKRPRTSSAGSGGDILFAAVHACFVAVARIVVPINSLGGTEPVSDKGVAAPTTRGITRADEPTLRTVGEAVLPLARTC